MAFSANYFDQYNKSVDNLRKRRKENAEMFEAYKDAKVADGEEVSVEELSNMRNNLAGGDFYFGQALPAESMLGALAERTNKRVTNKISEEFATQAENVEKISKVVTDIVPRLTSIDDYNGAAGKEKIKSIFAAVNPADPQFGNDLYDSWADRLPDMIEQARDDEVNAFMVKNADANMYSEVQHLTTGLPSWKKSGIEQAFKKKEMVFDNKNFSDALKNVNVNTKPEEFTQMGTAELDNFAKLYLLRNGVLEKDITPDRIAAAKAALLPLFNAETRRYSKELEDAFNDDVATDKALMDMMSDPAYDNKQEAFNVINRHRENNDLKPYPSINDPEFKKLYDSFATTGLRAAVIKWEAGKKEAHAAAKTSLEASLASTEAMFKTAYDSLKDNDKNKISEGIARNLHASYHIPPQLVAQVIDTLNTLVEDDEPETQAEMNAMMMLMADRYSLPTREQALLFYQKKAMASASLGIKPNTTYEEMVELSLEPLKANIKKTVAMIAMGARNVTTTQNGSQISAVKKKAIEEIKEYYRKLADRMENERFVLDRDQSQTKLLERIKKEEATMISQISMASPNGKPTWLLKLRPGVYVTNPTSSTHPNNIQHGTYAYVKSSNSYVYQGPLPQPKSSRGSRSRSNP